jgi:hypothetical protein
MVGERRAPNSSIKGEENVLKLRLVPPTRTRTAIGDEISGTGWSPETAVPFAQTLSVGTLVFIFFFLERNQMQFLIHMIKP